jgi:hypothetical protein
MNRNRKGAARRRNTIQPWTYRRAQTALPYFASVMRSLREHKLEAIGHRLTAQRLADRPGRPDRATLIRHEEALHNAQKSEARYQEALDELQNIDVYPLQPVHGRALVPFVHKDQLAWFVYDLFDPEPLRFWRFHNDPLETRRPVTTVQKAGDEEQSQLA